MTAVASEHGVLAVGIGTRLFERSDDVLWSIALPGVVLHNIAARKYLVVDELGYRLWAYLDGGRTTTEAVNAVAAMIGEQDLERIWQLVWVLSSHGFVVERPNNG